MRGSPASLAAELTAIYGGTREVAAGAPDQGGAFSIPDPDDLLRYLERNPAAEARACARLTEAGFALATETGRAIALAVSPPAYPLETEAGVPITTSTADATGSPPAFTAEGGAPLTTESGASLLTDATAATPGGDSANCTHAALGSTPCSPHNAKNRSRHRNSSGSAAASGLR